MTTIATGAPVRRPAAACRRQSSSRSAWPSPPGTWCRESLSLPGGLTVTSQAALLRLREAKSVVAWSLGGCLDLGGMSRHEADLLLECGSLSLPGSGCRPLGLRALDALAVDD